MNKILYYDCIYFVNIRNIYVFAKLYILVSNYKYIKNVNGNMCRYILSSEKINIR
jgi:hypothetical protein